MSLGLVLCIIFGVFAIIWGIAKSELSSMFWFLLAFWCLACANSIPFSSLFH
jgi:hypothetical protein